MQVQNFNIHVNFQWLDGYNSNNRLYVSSRSISIAQETCLLLFLFVGCFSFLAHGSHTELWQ